jgi:hypothetical protein
MEATMKGIFSTLFFFLFFAGQSLSMFLAQNPQAIFTDQSAQQRAVSGKVVLNEGNVLHVQKENQITQLVLPQVYAYEKDFGLENQKSLQVGDQVQIQINELGQVNKVTALSTSLWEIINWSVPVALSGIGFIFLSLKIWRKVQGWKSLDIPVPVAHI